MYLQHFGFTAYPFDTDLKAEQLYRSASIEEVTKRLEHLIELRGIALINVHLLSFIVHHGATHRLAVHRNAFVRIAVVFSQPVVERPVQGFRTNLYHHVANHGQGWHLAATVAKPAAKPCAAGLTQRARPHPDVLVATHTTERGTSRQRQHVCQVVLASFRTAPSGTPVK